MARFSVEVDNDGGFAFLNQYTQVYWSAWTKSIVQRRDGEIVAAIVYQDPNASNVFMHVAAKPNTRWITRDLIYYTFHFPFVQMGLRRVTGWVESTNYQAIRFDENLGFKREATLKGAGQDGQDVYLYTMFRENCKWLETLKRD